MLIDFLECMSEIQYLSLFESSDLLLHMTMAISHFGLPAPGKERKTKGLKKIYLVGTFFKERLKEHLPLSNFCKQ